MEQKKQEDVNNWLKKLSEEEDSEKLKQNQEFMAGLTFN